MSSHTHIPQARRDRILAELAALSLTLARDLHARALAAETPEEAAKLAAAFDCISRDVRRLGPTPGPAPVPGPSHPRLGRPGGRGPAKLRLN